MAVVKGKSGSALIGFGVIKSRALTELTGIWVSFFKADKMVVLLVSGNLVITSASLSIPDTLLFSSTTITR